MLLQSVVQTLGSPADAQEPRLLWSWFHNAQKKDMLWWDDYAVVCPPAYKIQLKFDFADKKAGCDCCPFEF